MKKTYIKIKKNYEYEISSIDFSFTVVIFLCKCSKNNINVVINLINLLEYGNESSSWNDSSMLVKEPRMVKIFTDSIMIYQYYDQDLFCGDSAKKTALLNGKYFYGKGKLKENILNHSNKNRIGEEYDIEISFSEDSNTYYQSMDFNNSKYKNY